MAPRLELVDAAGQPRAVELTEPGVVSLRAAGRGVEVVGAADARNAEVRVVPTRAGLRLEPVRAGAMVEVSGQQLFCKDLVDGDAFVVGACKVVFRSDSMAAAVGATARGPATSGARPNSHASRAHAAAASRDRSARERSSKPLLVSLVSLSIVCAIVALRWLDSATSRRDPAELLTFAKIQFESGQYDRARATLDDAVRDGDPDIRAEADRIRARIDQVEREAAATLLVSRAREAQESLASFEDRYARQGLERPAARELLRMCDAWLADHEAAIGGSVDGKSLVASVRARRERAVAKAEFGSPESAADAIFAARARLRFVVREYKAAVARIDAFCASHPEAADAAAEALAIRQEGKAWLERQVARMSQSVDRGEVARAREELAQIDQHSVLPEWEPIVAPVRAKLAAAATTK